MDNAIEKKDTCILLRSVVEAAKKLSPEEGLELLLAYSDYALGDGVDLEKCSELVKLILMQNIPIVNAYDSRYRKKTKPKTDNEESGSRKPFTEEELSNFLKEKAEENRANPTQGEKNFKSFCKSYGIPVRTQVPIIVHKRGYILDFVISSNGNPKRKGTKKRKIVVEIDGGYHNTEEQKKKDNRRDTDLKTAGFSVLRMTNEDTKSTNTMAKKFIKFCSSIKETTITSKFGNICLF